MALHIVDLGDLLCAQNKKHERLKWWCHPRHLSRRVKRLIYRHEDGWAHYGVWCVLLSEITERAPRDYLVDGAGKPVPLADLEEDWRMAPGSLLPIIERLCSQEIGLMGGLSGHLEGASMQCRGGVETEESRREEIRVEEIPMSSSRCERDGVGAVVEHYVKLHPRARPGAKVRKAIQARLGEGYSVSDLCAAIDGCHRSPHHCGENERGTKYQTLGLIVRDSDHVQQFMDVPLNGASAHGAENEWEIRERLEKQDRLNREARG